MTVVGDWDGETEKDTEKTMFAACNIGLKSWGTKTPMVFGQYKSPGHNDTVTV